MSLELTNIIRVSITGAESGLAAVNTSALAIITDEVPVPADFGTSRVYLDAASVADDFGSNSETYRLAVMVFNQKLNVITGKGFLIIIPRDQTAAVQPATILGAANVNLAALTAIDYNINAAVDGGDAGDLLIGPIDTTDLASVLVSLNSTAVASAGLIFSASGELASARITLKTIATGVGTDITLAAAGTGTDISGLLELSGSATGAATGVERVKDCILRTAGSVPYFGIILNEKQTDANQTEISALVQSLTKFMVIGSNLSADIAGIFTTLKDAGYTHTRCLFYSIAENDALDMAAGEASRLMSINFNASNTALTMHLKDITGLVADTGVTQAILDAAKIAGVDVYADFGIAKLFTSGANLFIDQIYTQLALQVDLQVAGFNFLAQTTTKIPQTEIGMDGLKGSYRAVLARYVNAGVYAPGTWTGSTFGDPADFARNIKEFGFYIYSQAVAAQAAIERTARIAPAVRIAAKESGAIHSSDVIVLVEP